jgi:ATP-binding cassette subfamily B protein
MRKASYRAAIYTAVYIPVVIFIGAAATALVLFWGGTMTFSQGLSIGILIAAFDYTAKIFIPIVEISVFYAQLQSSLSAGERVFSLIDEPIEIMDKPDATPFEEIQGDIEFRDVSFGYLPEQFVLENINLKIAAGESIALVGATGEGKTTIASLVARFYQPNSGQILIDGEDYCTKTLHSLRSQLGVVLQTPHLFKGTIRDNICYGKPEATDEEVENALEAVGAFAEFGPRLDEEIGEEGGSLSMGEQQLLSFARAVLVNPRIFIMDEATSSIDTITEAKIQKTIAQLLQGRTSIIIAHRLSTIRHCDRILVIDGGKIIEDGPHAALIEQKGKYFVLYTKQLKAESIL